MRLFLTSSPCDNFVPQGCDLPCILYETNQFVEQLRRGWQRGQRAVIIAADPTNFFLNDEMTCTFHRALAWHGMDYVSTTMVDRRNDYDLPQLLAESSLVILAGGHVPTQNAYFHQLGLRELMRRFDGTVMGISAGTMNCCGDVYAQPEEPGEALDPSFHRHIEGLGLTDVMILPHYQREKDSYLDGMRLYEDITYPDSMGHRFIALVDSSYVLVENGVSTLYGEAYRIENGVCTQISREGDVLRL